MRRMSVLSVVAKCCWVAVIFGCFIGWVCHSGYFCRRFAQFRIELRATVERPPDGLPLPDVLLCNREPLNRTALTLAERRLLRKPFILYLNQLLGSMDDAMSDGNPPLTDAEMTLYGNEFIKYFNESGRNRSAIERLMYDCEAAVASCSWAGESLTDCCANVAYVATPQGVCMRLRIGRNQTVAGPDGGFSMAFSFPTSLYRTSQRITDPGFNLFVLDDTVRVTSRKDGYPLDNARGYRLRLQAVEERRVWPSCPMLDGVPQRWRKHLTRSAGEKRADQTHCAAATIREQCGCEPIGVLWMDDGGDANVFERGKSPLCSLNETQQCAGAVVRRLGHGQLRVEDTVQMGDWENWLDDEHETVADPCAPPPPCLLRRFDVAAEGHSMPSVANRFSTHFSIFYERLSVRAVAEQYTMSVQDLLSYIAFCAAFWFGIIPMVSFAIRLCCCCCGKAHDYDKTSPAPHYPVSSPPIQQLPPLSMGNEPYKQTQTER